MRANLHRRLALLGLMVGAGLVVAGDAALAQSKYKEAPALAELVKAGKLPPVDKRLPENPLVVPVVEKVGEYGGVWRRAFLGPAAANNHVVHVFHRLVPFSPAAANVQPKTLETASPPSCFT